MRLVIGILLVNTLQSACIQDTYLAVFGGSDIDTQSSYLALNN